MSELIDCINNLSAEDIIRRIAKTANGVPFYLQTINGGFSGNPQYQAVYDSYTTKPDEATATIWNTFVAAAVANGYWIDLDVLYVYAAHTNGAAEALVNWKNPGTFDATAIHAPLFTINEGFTGDGANDYIDWNWNPNTDGVNYALDDVSVGAYIRNNAQENKVAAGVRNGANYTMLQPRTSLDRTTYYVNSGTSSIQLTVTSSVFFHMIQREGAANQELYKNGVLADSEADASTVIPDGNMFSLALNIVGTGAGSFCTNQNSMVYAGKALTAPKRTAFATDFEVAMDALGKGIIP